MSYDTYMEKNPTATCTLYTRWVEVQLAAATAMSYLRSLADLF